MYISEITIQSFRHLQNVKLGPFSQPPSHSDLVVLAGPNGGGKSSILELLGYALSNTWSLSWALHRSFPTNAFEVAITITPEERELIRQHHAQTQLGVTNSALAYLEENGTYYRAYNYSEGIYQRNPNLHNNIHNLVTNALRNYYNRSLGFFLRSDRFYPPDKFRRERLFNYQETTKLEYLWNMAFNTSDVQYKDMFEFLVQQRYHYFRQLGAYHHKANILGQPHLESPPSDPLKPYDELLQKLFPGYKFSDENEEIPSNLFVALPSNETIPFTDLSSGEKEVFFILSFFLRHDVSNAIIVVDEPELHLHPELARLLIRTMQSIKPANQLWLATHNAEIIDEAGRDRVFYISRDVPTQKAKVTPGTDEEAAIQQFRNLFGYSGYIGVSKTVVFLEGVESSADRKMFSNLFPQYGGKIKFVPAQTSENQIRLNAAILSILESNLGWIQFYLIRDRDYLPAHIVEDYQNHFTGRLYVLKRYHIENYLLDEELIAKVQTEIFNKPVDANHVLGRLKGIAQKLSAEVLRDMVAFRLNLIYRPQDFSLGKFMQGESMLNVDGSVDINKLLRFKVQLDSTVSEVNQNLLKYTDAASLGELISTCQEEVMSSITGSDEGWKVLFPGRRLLEEYSRAGGLGKNPILQNSLIKELSTIPERVPIELRKLIETIANAGTFK